ncbi:MAG: hypothetical protein ACOCZ8_05750 [Bacteroidota bacterium]
MSMVFLITLTFGALLLASAAWLGRVYLQLFYRVGFALMVLYFRKRPNGKNGESNNLDVSYQWHRTLPFWELMVSSLLALFVLLNIAEPILNQFIEPVGWLGLFLAGWGSIWLALPGSQYLLQLNIELPDGELRSFQSPDDTLRTSLAALILKRLKILVASTLLLLAIVCVLHASAPYAA